MVRRSRTNNLQLRSLLMPEGLQIFNDAGFVQIDANYLNMELKNRGSGVIPPSNMAAGGAQSSSITFTVNGENPAIAVISERMAACYLISRSGSSFTFAIYNGEDANNSVEWFQFDNSSAEGAGNSGLQVFNGGGRLVFDSNKKYLRVLDYWERGTGNLETRGYPGKRIAVIMCDYGYRFVVQNSPVDPSNQNYKFLQSQLDCARTASDSLSIQLTATWTNAFAPYHGEQNVVEGPSRWLVVDVTNF